MPKGPHELRLDTYVSGGSVEVIRHSAHTWDRGHTVLDNLAAALDSAKPKLMDRFGPQTGPAAVAAFEKVAANVRAQAAEMRRASAALTSAGNALEDAQTTHHRLGNAPASPPATPTQKAGESAEAFHLRQRDASTAKSQYATESAERERQSQAAVTDVDTHYEQAIAVMESIHGRPRATTSSGGGSGGDSVSTGGLPTRGSTSGSPAPHQTTTLTGAPDGPGSTVVGGTHGGQDPGSTHPGGGVDAPPTYGAPGTPQGPSGGPGVVPGGQPLPGAVIPGTPGSDVSLGHAVTSTAVGGTFGGGLVAGTSGLTGTMRAGATQALSSEELALAAGRTSPTGATAAAAAEGTRTSATGGRGGAVGMTGRSGGAGAGGRGERRRRRKRGEQLDFYADDESWLDDDEASPPVLH